MTKNYFKASFSITLCVVILLHGSVVFAQKMHPHDTSYYVSYPNTMARIYLSKKYAPFTLPAAGNVPDLEYRANTKLNLGVGVTYKNYTLNVAYGFKFINKNYGEQGKTKGLDLHFHLFPNKYTIDLLGVFHKGYYLAPKGYAAANMNSYYYRPDVKLTLLGVAGYRLNNSNRFSYRAAFVQNDWQKRSAGSFLYGGEAYYVSFGGDSAIVPKQLQTLYPQAGITKIKFISVGPGIGYAYTLVIAKHFFVTASVIGNLDVNFCTETSSSDNKKVSLKPAVIYKGAVGYNSDTWSLNATLTGNALLVRGASSPKDYFIPVGNYRLTLAKKLRRRG